MCLMLTISVPLVFVAGLLSFVSLCVLPMVPILICESSRLKERHF